MTFPTTQQAYAQSTGTSQLPSFVFEARDPTANDYNSTFKLYMGWVNTVTKGIWYLEALNASNGVVTPQWRAVGPIVVASVGPASPLTSSSDYAYPLGQTWVDDVADDYYVLLSNPTATTGYWVKLSSGGQSAEEFQVDAHTSPGTDPVVPDSSSVVTVTGGQVAAETTTNVIQTNSLAANTYAVQVQRSTAKVSTTVGSNGVCHFSSDQFSVDSNGFVTLSGGGQAVDSIAVDANTAPGTNPVVPTIAGLVTVTGGQVAAGTTTNVIRTISLAANTYTSQIQRSKTEASSTVGSNGVSHFSSADFSVDSNGFVSLVSGSGDIASVAIQTFTGNGTYTPTSGMKYAQIEVCGGGGGGGSSTTAATETSVGSGGSAGGYSRGIYSAATVGVSQSVTVGAGGTAGNAGGTTSVGALISATGGGAGQTVSSAIMALVGTNNAGSGSSGSVNITGGMGEGGLIIIDTGVAALGMGGRGGGSYFGAGPVNSSVVTGGTVTSNGTAGQAYGAGGSGAASINPAANATGGTGAGGIVIITEFVS